MNTVAAGLSAHDGVADVRITPVAGTKKGPVPGDLGELIVDVQVELVAAIVASAAISVFGVLIRWARRRPERSVIVEKDGRQVHVKGDSSAEELTSHLLDGVEPPERQRARPDGRRYALLFTTSSYEDATLQALPSAESDGRMLADILKDPEVGGYQRVQQLHNPAARAAVRAVKMFFRERVAGDLALVYFSGHGLKKDNELFFATADTDAAELPATTVPAKLLADEAAKSKCGQVVVVLDCCYGGAFPAGHGQYAPEQVQSALSPLVSRPDFVLLSATGETEFAVDVQSGAELGGADFRYPPSLFTELIIDGLDSGDADENGDGEVTPQELFNYLNNQLGELHPDSQSPVFEERRRGPIVIAKSRQVRAAVPAQIKKRLADPTTFSGGLQDLLRLDERRRGRQRGAVVRTLMSAYVTGDAASRTEITHVLARLAQHPVTRHAVPPRRRRPWRFRRPAAIAAAVTILTAIVAGVAIWAATVPDNSIADVAGEITINGSSTIEPIVQGVATEFDREAPRTHVSIAGAGTGTGFSIFCGQQAGSDGIDMVGASRPIRADENAACAKNKIRYERFLIGYDGMSVVASTRNEFLTSLTYDQLRAIFGRPNLQSWRQVDPTFPDLPIATCTPDDGSGTFDFFVDHVLSGESGSFREDGPRDVRSQDDNNLVQCVQTNPLAIGFFGYAYYRDNASRLKLLAIAEKPGAQPEIPTDETVLADLYPLKRPLFIYARADSIEGKPQVKEFLRFLIRQAETVVRKVGYVPAYGPVYSDQLARVDGLAK